MMRLASAILITTSEKFAKKVDEEVKGFVEVLSRKEIIQKSLDNFGYILIAEDMDEAIEAANEIAPEHMEIVTANPFEDMMKVTKCRCDLYRRVQFRATGRLFCRSEPCTSYKRNSQIFLSPFRR